MKAFCFGLGAALLATSAQAALLISTDATSNITCAAGVCSATAADAVLNVSDVTAMLGAGSLTVQSGSTAQDILVEAPFSWTSSNALTLDSYRAITVDKPVSDAGPAALNIAFNDGGTGGELLFRYKGRISFTSTKNALNINGQAYKLVKDIASLASAIAKNPSGFYALKDNYNAAKDGTYSTAPIHTNFTGTFEGLGNAISNLSVDCEHNKLRIPVGLFANIYLGGTVKSIRLRNISITDHDHKWGAGGLVGWNSGSLFDDISTGSISSGTFTGGLAGINTITGTIVKSAADVRIKSPSYVGGLVGGNGGLINLSHATGDVRGRSIAGGLVAINDNGNIDQSFASGAVKGGYSGGLIGWIESGGPPVTISNSYATGAVASDTGGGFAEEDDETNVAVIFSYSTGAVSQAAGGFICREISSKATDSYWDMTTSGTTKGICGGNETGITGLTDAQLKSGLPSGFDPAVWAQSPKINNGYPYLINNPPPK